MTDLERVKEAASYIRRQEPRADVVNALGIIEFYS